MTQAEGPSAPLPQWPRVVGAIGIAVGALMIVDKLDDLVLSWAWSKDDWSRWFEPEVAEMVMQALATPWFLIAGVVGTLLGALLIVGSVRLRQRRLSGIALCRLWSWLAVAWALVEIVVALTWLLRHGRELQGLPAGAMETSAGCGVLVALAVMLAYPVFLLIWLSRDRVQAHSAGWAE